MNQEIIRILNDKSYDYLFENKIRTPIFNKIETHKFIAQNKEHFEDFEYYKCSKCGAFITFDYYVSYSYNEFDEILTCEEEIIKNIIE